MRRRDLTRLPVRHRLSATERASASRNGFLMSRPWMPLYVADYLADTGHLTTAEHGAYLLLIMHYWKNGGLPDDDGKLARIARCSLRDWLGMRQTLSEFFGEGWTHGRIEREIASGAASHARLLKMVKQRDERRPPPAEWQELRTAIFGRDDYTCQYCGTRGGSLQCDHVVPVARGGSNTADNLKTACEPCNKSKGALLLSEWGGRA